MKQRDKWFLRNILEFAIIFGIWAICREALARGTNPKVMLIVVMALALMKTAFFGIENLGQLFAATRCNQAYHRFMLLMLVNMSQIILSFGLDFCCLERIHANSFGIDVSQLSEAERVFEFTYFSTLNFTFFGYGDMTPQTIPAKLLTMVEILLAFVTVIFLLSDFMSLKESLRGKCDDKPIAT